MTSWNHFCQSVLRYPSFAFSLDYSLMNLREEFFQSMEGKISQAYADMRALEAGAIANPDENRMVGHYWLRNPALAPSDEIRAQITEPLAALVSFAQKIHTAQITPPQANRYEQILLIGIGGSALGPQLVADALSHQVKIPLHFLDNTDPEGIDRTLAALQPIGLAKTLVLVISKSGGTPETRNGMLEAKAAFEKQGLHFGKQTVAITGTGSQLDQFATKHQFLTTFPMQDWIGGRTSVMSTVGLVPAALQGIDIQEFLRGASAMDELTRQTETRENAAMLLALAWYQTGNGKGEKAMVVLPYKDSLCLFSKYLQQLVMESLGKELDLDGNTVHQGLSVYGNKGSTDQHAYVQQLRDGLNNFFATFIEVRKGRNGNSIEVEPSTSSADYLQGFLRGTRKALYQAGRQSLTISIPEVTPFHLGAIIALFERAVSFYASLVHINAYHQPGVEAGKKAATTFLTLLNQVRGKLTAQARTASEMANECSGEADPEDVYHCLTHLHANGEAQIAIGETPAQDTFSL